MASTITITCPECDKQMKAPAEVLGKKVRCKGCGATFPARAESGAAAPASAKPPAGKAGGGKAPAAKKPADKAPAPKPAAKKPADEGEDDKPYGMTFEKLSNRCPDCANELESEEAVVCLVCGYNTQTREKARTRKVREVTGGDVFLWVLPGILCVVGLIILFVINLIFCLYAHEWVDENEWYSFFFGKATKIWLVVISLFVAAGAGKFAIKRLIQENRPPEVEEKLASGK